MKQTLWLVFLVCSGIVLGSLVSELTSDISWLSWLSYGLDFGLNPPFSLDLGAITLTIGLSVSLTVGVIIFVAFAILVGVKIRF